MLTWYILPFVAPANNLDSALSITVDVILESKWKVHNRLPELISHNWNNKQNYNYFDISFSEKKQLQKNAHYTNVTVTHTQKFNSW